LKNASKRVFKIIEESGKAIADAEDRMYTGEINERKKE
jgi:hypothetical protein